MSKHVVILMHGVGSNGADMAELGSLWQPLFPNVQFISPNAPYKADFGDGYQWFSIQGVTPESRPKRIVDARSACDELLNEVFKEHKIDPQVDDVILVGFSQGSIMAMDILSSERFPVKGIVAFSGRLASPEPYIANKSVPVLLVHGKQDPVIPWFESESAASRLNSLGHEVETFFEESTVHTISIDGAKKAAEFMLKLLKL
ncbi:alpha/beta hydrolase [Vibrio viridaestus]|uniref:Phospholipase n=1 Tax=Vibrio viridaestus TaxID=2487322 RepID=A0A3N9TJU1_9VIBR|nr:dienelactone hydrolase family protein [Vibrio viridaestus]RQW64490.1 phospholipase [Vibrio viridaestus]